MGSPTLRYPDALAVEAAIQRCLAQGFITPGYEDAARERFRRQTIAPLRPPDLAVYDTDVGGDANFDSLADGSHVEHAEVFFEGEGFETDDPSVWPNYFLRLWLTEPRDLLPGHFTWV